MEPSETTDTSEPRQPPPPNPTDVPAVAPALGEGVPEQVQAYLVERGQLAAGD